MYLRWDHSGKKGVLMSDCKAMGGMGFGVLLMLAVVACSDDDSGGGSAPGAAVCDRIVAADCAQGPDMTQCLENAARAEAYDEGDCASEQTALVSCMSTATWTCVEGRAAPTGCESQLRAGSICLAKDTQGADAACTEMVALQCADDGSHDDCMAYLGSQMVRAHVQGCASEGEALGQCFMAATDLQCINGRAMAPSCSAALATLVACLGASGS